MPGHQLCFLESAVKSAKTKEVLLLLELTKMQIKKKKTCFLSKTPTLIGTAWSLFYNLFPPGKAEIDPYLVYFWSTISVLVLIKNSICLTLLRFWFVELISFHLLFFYKYLCTYLTKNLFLNIYFSKCQHLLYESAVFCSIPSPAKASSVHPWDPPQFHCTYIFG